MISAGMIVIANELKGSTVSNGNDVSINPNVIELDYDTYIDFFLGSNYENYYYDVETNLPVLKQTQQTTLDKTTIVADGVDTVTISNAPAGICTITSATEQVTGAIDGSDTFTTTIIGSYILKITSPTFFDFSITIEAT